VSHGDNFSSAQWRGRRKSERSVESSHIFKIFHFVLAKRFMVPSGDNRRNDMCKYSNLLGFFEAELFGRCDFLGGILATTDSQFDQVTMKGVQLLQNTRNTFHRVLFSDCIFLNVIDNQFEDVTFLNCTFHSSSDQNCNTFVNVYFPGSATLVQHHPNDPDFLEQLQHHADTIFPPPRFTPEESGFLMSFVGHGEGLKIEVPQTQGIAECQKSYLIHLGFLR
jgi:hypothetical protein